MQSTASTLQCAVQWLVAKNGKTAPGSLQHDRCLQTTWKEISELASPMAPCSFPVVAVTSLVMSLLQACVVLSAGQSPEIEISKMQWLMKRNFNPHHVPSHCFLPLPCAGSSFPVATHKCSGFCQAEALDLHHWAGTQALALTQGRLEDHIAGDIGAVRQKAAPKTMSLNWTCSCRGDVMALHFFVIGMFPSRSFWLFCSMLENNLTVASRTIYSRGCCISVDSNTTV